VIIPLAFIEDALNRMDFCSEEIPNDLPSPKGPKFKMTFYVDADHA
jgi:hypothetical protein